MPEVILEINQGSGTIPADHLERLVSELFREQLNVKRVRVTNLPEGHSGLSPIQIYLAYPSDMQESEFDPLLIRVGAHAALTHEHENFTNFIERRTDFPVVQERYYKRVDDLAITAYDFLGDHLQPLQTLREFLWRDRNVVAAAQTIHTLLLDTLGRVAEQRHNGWYNDARSYPEQRPLWYYNTMLPSTMKLELMESGCPEAELPAVTTLLALADQPLHSSIHDRLVSIGYTDEYPIEVIEEQLQGDPAHIRLRVYQGVPLARSIYQSLQPIVAQLDLTGPLALIERFMGDLRQPAIGRIKETRFAFLESKRLQLRMPTSPLSINTIPYYLANPLETYYDLLNRPRTITTSIVHGDLNLSNILVRQLGQTGAASRSHAKSASLISWLIDFDKTGSGAHTVFDAVKLETEYKIHVLPHLFYDISDFMRLEYILYEALIRPNNAERLLREGPHLLDAYHFIATIRRSTLRQMPGCNATPTEYYLGLLAYGITALKYRNLYKENSKGWLSQRLCVEHLAAAAYLSASFAATALTLPELEEAQALSPSYPDIRRSGKGPALIHPWLVGRDGVLSEAIQRLIMPQYYEQSRNNKPFVVLYGQPGSGRDAVAAWLTSELQQLGYTICPWTAPTTIDITVGSLVHEICTRLQELGIARPILQATVTNSKYQQPLQVTDTLAMRNQLIASLEPHQSKLKRVALVLRFYNSEPEICAFLSDLVRYLDRTVLIAIMDHALPELDIDRPLEIRPLTLSDVKTYVYYERLDLNDQAIGKLYQISQGLPRLLLRAIIDTQRYREQHGGTFSEAMMKQPDQLTAELAREVLRYMAEPIRRLVGLDALLRAYSRDDKTDFATIFATVSHAMNWALPPSLTDDVAIYMRERENDDILRPSILQEALVELYKYKDFGPMCEQIARFYQGLPEYRRADHAIPLSYLAAQYYVLAEQWSAAAKAIRPLSETPALLYTSHCADIYQLVRDIIQQRGNSNAALLEIAGRCAAYLGQATEALEYYQDLYELIYTRSDPEYVRLLVRMIQAYRSIDKPEESLTLSSDLITITSPSEPIYALGRASQGYALTETDPHEAARLFEEAIALLEQTRDHWGDEASFFEEQQALISDELAHMYVEQLPEKINRAIQLLKSAHRHADKLNPAITARLHNDLGYIYYYVRGESRDAEHARKRFADALDLRERLGDRVGQLRSAQNLANAIVDLAADVRDWDRAEHIFQTYETKRWFEQITVTDRDLIIVNHLHLLTIRGDFASAHKLLARESLQRLSDETTQLWLHLNQADLALWEQQPQQCQEHLAQALHLIQSTLQSPAEQCEWSRIMIQAHLLFRQLLDPVATELLTSWVPTVDERPIDTAEWYLARGLINLAQSDYPATLADLEKSRAIWLKSNYHFRVAEVGYWQAYCQVRLGDPALVQNVVQDVEARLLPFGATPLLDLLHLLQKQITAIS